MNIAMAMGYVPQYEPWNFFFCVIIVWSVVIILGGLTFEYYLTTRKTPHWTGGLLFAAALFSMHPFGLITMSGFIMGLFEMHTSAGVISLCFVLYSIYSFLNLVIFGGRQMYCRR